MECVNQCGACLYAKRCKPSPVKIVTTYNRTCKEYYEENSPGWCCVKYNPVLSECKSLALRTFKNRYNLDCSDSDSLKTQSDVLEAFLIFKQIFEYVVSLENLPRKNRQDR